MLVPMAKVEIIGPKSLFLDVVSALHEQGKIHIEDLSKRIQSGEIALDRMEIAGDEVRTYDQLDEDGRIAIGPVLDAVEAIASRIVLFKITNTTPQAQQLTRIVAECGVQIEQAVGHLKGFKGLMSFTIEINRLENEADGLSRQAVADLFNGQHDFLDVIRWKEIYGRLENATDQCEDVANVIESIVLKSR